MQKLLDMNSQWQIAMEHLGPGYWCPLGYKVREQMKLYPLVKNNGNPRRGTLSSLFLRKKMEASTDERSCSLDQIGFLV